MFYIWMNDMQGTGLINNFDLLNMDSHIHSYFQSQCILMDVAINIIAFTKVNYILDARACVLEMTDYHEKTDLPIILKTILTHNIS